MVTNSPLSSRSVFSIEYRSNHIERLEPCQRLVEIYCCGRANGFDRSWSLREKQNREDLYGHQARNSCRGSPSNRNRPSSGWPTRSAHSTETLAREGHGATQCVLGDLQPPLHRDGRQHRDVGAIVALDVDPHLIRSRDLHRQQLCLRDRTVAPFRARASQGSSAMVMSACPVGQRLPGVGLVFSITALMPLRGDGRMKLTSIERGAL